MFITFLLKKKCDNMNGTNTTRNYTDSVSSKTVVVIESIVSCSLSILGSFAIFGSYIILPEIRNSTRKLVTCLTIADFFTALGNIYVVYSLACFLYLVIQTYSNCSCNFIKKKNIPKTEILNNNKIACICNFMRNK
jgi:hypothetical protein